MRSYIVIKENLVDLVVSKIFRYRHRQTDRQTQILLLLYKDDDVDLKIKGNLIFLRGNLSLLLESVNRKINLVYSPQWGLTLLTPFNFNF